MDNSHEYTRAFPDAFDGTGQRPPKFVFRRYMRAARAAFARGMPDIGYDMVQIAKADHATYMHWSQRSGNHVDPA